MEGTPKTSGLAMRPARDADREWLRRLHKASYQPFYQRVQKPWDDAHDGHLFDDRLAGADEVLVISELGRDVGAVCLSEQDGQILIDTLEIRPDCQNRGIGATTIKWATVRAHQQGKIITLRLHKLNKDAKRMYERSGFSVIGETENEWTMQRLQ